MNITTLLPYICLALGALMHSMSVNDGASILAHFGWTWRLKPWMAAGITLLCTIGLGAIKVYQGGGATWPTALETAAVSTILAACGGVANHNLVGLRKTA